MSPPELLCEVSVKFLSIGDFHNEYLVSKKLLINMAAKSIETIYSGEEVISASDATHKEVVNFVESFNTDQFAKIIAYIEAAPAITYDVNYDCPKCGHHNERSLKGLSDFFI